jgi:hypothetical protein
MANQGDMAALDQRAPGVLGIVGGPRRRGASAMAMTTATNRTRGCRTRRSIMPLQRTPLV